MPYRLLVLAFFFLLLPVIALAQASQPASQPAVNPMVAWLQTNWYWLLVVVVIPALINGLKAKTLREGIIGFLAAILDRSTVTTNKDSPGTFKLPGTASKPPRG